MNGVSGQRVRCTRAIECQPLALSLAAGSGARPRHCRLAAVAEAGKEGLAAIESEVKAKLDAQRERLLAAGEKVLRGGAAPRETDTLLVLAGRTAESTRAQKTEALIVSVAGRVRRILTPEQAERIETDLAPSFDQPWRGYSRVLTGPGAPARGGGRMPADPGKWLKDLRDLRIDSAEGDPAYEIQDFAKKLTRGLPARAPHFEEAVAQGRAFATRCWRCRRTSSTSAKASWPGWRPNRCWTRGTGSESSREN